MGSDYKGVFLNETGDPAPWSPIEPDAFKAIIDALAIGTVEGTLTGAKVIGHRHPDLYSQVNNIQSLLVNSAGNVEIFNNLQIQSMTTEGFVKNDNSGNLTGGNIIDISDIIDQLPPHFINGFVDRNDSEMSFDNGTRTFTIDVKAPATEFVVWSNNDKFTKTGPDTLVIPDTQGPVLIFYDEEGDLDFIYQGDPMDDDLYLVWALVTVISWDVPDQEQIFFGEERHGIDMSPATTLYLHSTVGARLAHEPGFALADFTIDQNGDDDEDAQFSVAGGEYYNEDIKLTYTTTVPQSISPIVNAPVYYLEGATPIFKKDTATAFPVKPFVGGSSRLAYNEDVGGTWQQTETPNADFLLCHIFVTNELTEPIIAIQGQNTYTTNALAQDGAEAELLTLSVLIPTNEIIPVATVIYQTNTGMTNTVKGAVVSTTDGTYIDWRFLRIGGAAIGSQNDHNALFNLTVGDVHTQYMKIAGRVGGQIVNGGTGAGDDLQFQTTSNVTKGNYFFPDIAAASGVARVTVGGALLGGYLVNLTADVTGDLPIAEGGTGASTAQLGFDALSPTTTKGDIITRDSANNIRLPVGADGQGIVADSTTPEGIKWTNVSGGGSLSFAYRFSTTITPPPPDNRLSYDAVGQITATQMFVDKDTDNGEDIHNFLANLAVGDRLAVFKNNDSGQFQEWRIDVVTDNTAYITYDITLIAEQGLLFINGDRVTLIVLGASSGSVTRQNTYDNSGAPQTTTSDSKGKVITKRGTTGGDTDDVWEVQNGSGMPKFAIKGNGFNAIGRTQYDSRETVGTEEVFIAATNSWVFALGTGDDTKLRIGQTAITSDAQVTIGSLQAASEDFIAAINLIASKVRVSDDASYDGYDLVKNGPSGVRNFHYQVETITTPAPNGNSIRYNNATQSSATIIYADGSAFGMFDIEAMLDNVDDTATLYINNEARTKFQQFTLTAVTPQAGYTEFTVTFVKSFGGNFSSEELVQFFLQEGASGGGSVTFPSFQFYADQLDTPVNSDWAVNSHAHAANDSNNAALTVRRFDDGSNFDNQSVGTPIRLPTTATNIIFTFQSRAEVAPGSSKLVALNLYSRIIPNNSAVGSWSSAFQMTDISIPTNENFQTDTQTISFASLSLTAGETYQFQLARDTLDASDTLVGDWALFMMGVDFT